MGRYFLTSYLLLAVNFIVAQDWSVKYHGIPEDYSLQKKELIINNSNVSSAPRSIQTELINRGYLAASIDSTKRNDSLKILDIYLFAGEMYQFSELSFSPEHEEALSLSGYRNKLFNNSPLNAKQLSSLMENLLIYYENAGYPFVSAKLDSASFQGNKLKSHLAINKGPLIKIDSIYIKGGVKNSSKIIHTIIKVKPGDIFNQKLINQIDNRISETPYLTSIKPTEYEFVNGNCNLYLYVKNNPSSNINGIIGILQDDNDKLTITGDARIKLTNSFYKGEVIDINWRKLQSLTQNLKTHFNYPYILNTSFGVDVKFDLFKKDTSFINIFSNLGIQYSFNSDNKLTVFYQNRTSNLLSTVQFATLTSLPEFADISYNAYGLGLTSQNLDYKYNPTRGYFFEIAGSVGNKKIKKNNSLNPVIYEGVKLTALQYNLISEIYYHIPIKKRNTIKIGVKSGLMFSENMFLNEMHRIGGNLLLRGFNEESIFASSYAVSTLEYRFLLEKNSNLFAFVDAAWYEKDVSQDFLTDTPIGIGTGISFSTKPGIFSVSYALGQQLGNPILFKTAKIHFGFVNFF